MMQEKRRLIVTLTTTELLFLVKLNTRGPNVTQCINTFLRALISMYFKLNQPNKVPIKRSGS